MNIGGVATAAGFGSRSHSNRERRRSSKIAASPSSMLAYKDGDRVRLVSRNRRDLTRRFRDLATAIAKLSVRTLVLSTQFTRVRRRSRRSGPASLAPRSLAHALADMPYAGSQIQCARIIPQTASNPRRLSVMCPL